MRTILLEVRDRMTCIVVMATSFKASEVRDATTIQDAMVSHAGFDVTAGYQVLLTNLTNLTSQYSPYEWGDRTMKIAHNTIARDFHKLKDGDIIDVEFELDETQTKKTSDIGKHIHTGYTDD